MPLYPALPESDLAGVCGVICDSEGGLTDRQVGSLLARCHFPDPFPGGTKRYRLLEAFKAKQKADLCANNVLTCIESALDPAFYVGTPDRLALLRALVADVLAPSGFRLDDRGRLLPTDSAKKLSESEE
jgi:hypothetical protein